MRSSHARGVVVVALLTAACGKVDSFSDASIPDANPIDGAGDSPDAAEGAHLTVEPLTYDFGPVAASAQSGVATFTFRNDGASTATGCVVANKGGADPAAFTIIDDNCGTDDLAAGDSCTVLVRITPADLAQKSMTLARTCAEGGTAMTTANGIAVNRPMRIFISSVSYTGNLGGLAGADALCQGLADAGSLTSGLGLTWKALLSKTTGGVVDAKDRFVWTGPVVDLAGVMVTANPTVWPWVNAGTSEIAVNENNGPPDDSYVWTGTTVDGVTKGANSDCNGWVDATNSFNGWAGQTSDFPSDSWIDAFGSGCADQFYGLYCISQ